jgi:hypothetical protein
MALPDFLIVGALKAGTTALHAALATHPQLYLSPVKEPKFFLCDGRPPTAGAGPGDAHSAREWIWRRDRYEALFADAPAGMLRGESTPLYLYDPRAHERIRRLVPAPHPHAGPGGAGRRPGRLLVTARGLAHRQPAADPGPPAPRGGPPPLPPDERAEVLSPLVDDIRRLERVTGRSFADWIHGEGRGEFSARQPVEAHAPAPRA